MAMGLSLIATELALRRNVFVKIFYTISPKPFFITFSDTFSTISSVFSEFLNGDNS
jgi:hypothetical protein